MFVEPTPGSELKRRVQGIVKRHGMKIKIIERVGETIKGILQRSNPFGSMPCERNDCPICSRGLPANCRSRGCVYQMKCVEHGQLYRGQTGRSAYERTKEQVSAWENGDEECPLMKHSMLYHEGKVFEIDVRILSECFGKPTRRMITEAVMIDSVPQEKAMNNKSEWTYVKLSKVRRT